MSAKNMGFSLLKEIIKSFYDTVVHFYINKISDMPDKIVATLTKYYR